MLIEITKENFDKEVNKSKLPVLLDFWAPWCGPCRMLNPTIKELADEYDGKIVVGKVNVDNEKEIAAKFEIMSIPTVLVILNGEIKARGIGYRPKDAFKNIIEEFIK